MVLSEKEKIDEWLSQMRSDGVVSFTDEEKALLTYEFVTHELEIDFTPEELEWFGDFELKSRINDGYDPYVAELELQSEREFERYEEIYEERHEEKMKEVEWEFAEQWSALQENLNVGGLPDSEYDEDSIDESPDPESDSKNFEDEKMQGELINDIYLEYDDEDWTPEPDESVSDEPSKEDNNRSS